jgi:hypothetical protein
MQRRTWLVTGVFIPLIAASIAAIPVWLQVIQPRIDDDSKPTPTPTVVVQPTMPDYNDLYVALLEENDLAEGWQATHDPLFEEPCGIHYRQGERGVNDQLRFPADPEAAWIYHEISAFGPGEGKAELDSIIRTIDTCPSSRSTAPDGQVVDSIIDPFAMPPLADQSYAFREIVPGGTGMYTTDTVIIRYGDVLSILIVTLPREADDAFTGFVDFLAGVAADKLAFALYG